MASSALNVSKIVSILPSTIQKESPNLQNKTNIVIPRKTSGEVNVQEFVTKSRATDINEENKRKHPPVAFKQESMPLPKIPVKQSTKNLNPHFETNAATNLNSFRTPTTIPENVVSGVIPGETALQRAQRLDNENVNRNTVSPIYKCIRLYEPI